MRPYARSIVSAASNSCCRKIESRALAWPVATIATMATTTHTEQDDAISEFSDVASVDSIVPNKLYSGITLAVCPIASRFLTWQTWHDVTGSFSREPVPGYNADMVDTIVFRRRFPSGQTVVLPMLTGPRTIIVVFKGELVHPSKLLKQSHIGPCSE